MLRVEQLYMCVIRIHKINKSLYEFTCNKKKPHNMDEIYLEYGYKNYGMKMNYMYTKFMLT